MQKSSENQTKLNVPKTFWMFHQLYFLSLYALRSTNLHAKLKLFFKMYTSSRSIIKETCTVKNKIDSSLGIENLQPK
jgi:hypothetical protein